MRRRFHLIIIFLLMAIIPLFITSETNAANNPPVLIGIYPRGNLFSNIFTPGWGTDEIQAIDAWIQSEPGLEGKGVSIAATFVDLEANAWAISHELGVTDGFGSNGAWVNGYVPFLNINTSQSGASIANGDYDAAITVWATTIRDWASSGEKHVYLAPFPEMNGNWTPWSNPADYKKAMIRFQRIFEEQGVPDDVVRWVFAPNFASSGNRPPVDDYYPGNSFVDVFGFSAFNYGDCLSGYGWKDFDDIYKPALDDHKELAPGKPFFITQMGVVDDPRKDAWLLDTLTKLADYPRVRAIIYFHIEQSEPNLSCDPVDYRIFQLDDATFYTGFLEALQNTRFQRWVATDTNWDTTGFAPRAQGTFEDNWPVSPFSDQNNPWYFGWIESIHDSGLTAGCMSSEIELPDLGFTHTYRYFCPDSNVTRGEMSVFLLRGLESTSYTPPPPSNPPVFLDIDGHWAEAWIEELKLRGISAGFPDGTYHPDEFVKRGEMAVFLLRARHYDDPFPYSPSPASGGVFSDIEGFWAQDWIEELADEGITSGFGDGTYKPLVAVLRKEMAVFLVRTFDLTLP